MARGFGGGALVHVGTLPPVPDEALLALTRVTARSIKTHSTEGSTVVLTTLTLVDVSALESITNKTLIFNVRNRKIRFSGKISKISALVDKELILHGIFTKAYSVRSV